MSTTLTLGSLWQECLDRLGFDISYGTFSAVTSAQFTDTTRNDADGIWNNAWIADTTVSGGAIGRINQWTQSNNTGTFFGSGITGAVAGDAYQLCPAGLSFPALRRAINSGISTCGKTMRILVRDETQTLTANTYTYTPGYSAAGSNAFFPGGVIRVEFLYWVGQPTRAYTTIEGVYYLDDFTLQFPEAVCDTYAGSPIRFTGMGPLLGRITADNPATVIGTFQDEFYIDALVWACCAHMWHILAAKKTSGESQHELEQAAYCGKMYEDTMHKWRRGLPVPVIADDVMTGGWRGEGV